MKEDLRQEIIELLEGIEDTYVLNFINEYIKRIVTITKKKVTD